jgi:peptidoglycan biosynthesis protein MviN/MurJ (putative lipid II flippase)
MAIASRTEGGAAAWDYAFTFFSAVLGVAVAGVINYGYPRLSAFESKTERIEETERTATALLSLVLPSSLLLCFLAPEIVTFFYRNGRFGTHDTLVVAYELSALALTLPFCAVVEFFRRLALLADRRAAAYLPSIVGGATAILLTSPSFGIVNAAIPFFAVHGIASLMGYLCLRRELGSKILTDLPPILMGCGALCLVYLTADRLLPPPLRLPIPFVIIVALGGAIAHLTVCRIVFGKERSPHRI